MHFKNLSIVFNGEIYNYREIKDQLQSIGHIFNSDSDTEVILHAYWEWGEQAVEEFIGMFAFVLYNRNANELICYRDRAGVKPFYYYQSKGIFLFGSEIKSLVNHPQFRKNINNKALPAYLQFGYIPAPLTIFDKCNKLKPGHYLKVNLENEERSITSYWSTYKYFSSSPLDISYEEAKSTLHQLLISSFKYRMVADVPVGVFLSGGYDSTAVTAILQSQMANRLKTFTIGFKEGNNEAPHAKATADYLDTEHTEYYCSEKEAQKIIPDLPYYFDEPFGDSSAIPTMLVSRLARQSVTVALSADGGDESFCGYNSYFRLHELNAKLNQFPGYAKPFANLFGSAVSRVNLPLAVEVQHKLRSALTSASKDQTKQGRFLFKLMKEKPTDYIAKYFNFNYESVPTSYDAQSDTSQDIIKNAMCADYNSYLSDDILAKVDRASMSVSLEGREPMLDHRIIEFSARLPINYMYDFNQNGKKILKDIVHEYIPQSMMQRPKAGFSLPIYKWLRGDLSHLLDEYLSDEALAWSGVWNTAFVSHQVRLFKEEKMHYSPLIWYVLMFQMWWKQWML